MPTMTELDAAAPRHPVFVALATQGAVNRLASAWLADHGVKADGDGALSAASAIAALNALRAVQTFEERQRSIRDLLAYYAGAGVTTHVDNAGGWPPGTAPAAIAQTGDGGLQYLDPVDGYTPELALAKKGDLPGRLRLLMYLPRPDAGAAVPQSAPRQPDDGVRRRRPANRRGRRTGRRRRVR